MTRTLVSSGKAKYLLLVHLIFVVKYRKKLLRKYGDEVKAKMTEISTRSNFEIDTIEVDADHIHLLVSYEPHISISQIVRVLKGETTHDLWAKHEPALRLQFWKTHLFWSPSYFACSVGNASQEVIRQYIENQG
jgi:putative transposase